MGASRRTAAFCILLCSVLVWTGCSSDRGADLITPQSSLSADPAAKPVEFAIPAGYYDTADLTNSSTLRLSVHAIIDDHTRYPYTAASTDTWNILELADEDPANSGNIVDIYRNVSYTKFGAGNTDYNREHTWPSSYGFPNDGSANYPYSDCFQLFLCNDSYNSSRSNKPFRYCSAACSENPTDLTNGIGGGSGVYPGNSNWTSGLLTAGTWEVWQNRRGDIARAMFYMDVRYEGGNHNVTGVAEPDLILTDNESLILASNTGSNLSVAYMGMLTDLLQWHLEDPVDDAERLRNDVVSGFQGNRNPFIDHPEWVTCVFEGVCDGGGGGDTIPPDAPTGLVATAGNGSVDLDWDDNLEADLAGYHVLRATAPGGPFAQVGPSLVGVSLHTDNGLTNDVTYYYQITAVDTSANESLASSTANATPIGGGGGTPGVAWINEFHYDNASIDTGEFVEVAGSAGGDLTGWSLVGYNGNGGAMYQTVNLSGNLPDQGSGFGTLAFVFVGMQNGGPDGIALIDDLGAVVEFLSYEGTMTAIDGPAAGVISTDVGVAETFTTPIGESLQRTGTGSVATDFTWIGPLVNTRGAVNTGQIFEAPVDTTPPDVPTALVAIAGNGVVDLDWADNVEVDLAGYTVSRSTTLGGPYAALNVSLLVSSLYSDATVTNGTTYYYVVEAEDFTGNASASSAEASALPTGPPPAAVVVWINEFHYDNEGTDANEFVEVAGLAGSDLSGWSLVAYNGNGGARYNTVNLAGVIANQKSGYGTLGFTYVGLQNGGPDGIALVDDMGNVVEFISYEGSFTAVDGPAAGMLSIDIGVAEPFTTSADQSLQLMGTGTKASDFIWQTPWAASRGSVNFSQAFERPDPSGGDPKERPDEQIGR